MNRFEWTSARDLAAGGRRGIGHGRRRDAHARAASPERMPSS